VGIAARIAEYPKPMKPAYKACSGRPSRFSSQEVRMTWKIEFICPVSRYLEYGDCGKHSRGIGIRILLLILSIADKRPRVFDKPR
jgi:hypothetical protein